MAVYGICIVVAIFGVHVAIYGVAWAKGQGSVNCKMAAESQFPNLTKFDHSSQM